jgi:hypothetical protein
VIEHAQKTKSEKDKARYMAGSRKDQDDGAIIALQLQLYNQTQLLLARHEVDTRRGSCYEWM